MSSFLEVANGRYGGSSVAVEAGGVCRVGAEWGLELSVDDDPGLAPVAFAVTEDRRGGGLFSLAGPVFKNGEPVAKGPLLPGDWILAGRTLFRYTRPESRSFSGEAETPLDWLRTQLLARLDVCFWLDLDGDVPMRRRLEGTCQCLPWAESEAEERALGGDPWLVRPGARPALVDELLRRYWASSRMMILWPGEDVEETREVFRRLPVFRLWGTETVALRFWDPRFWRMLEADGASPGGLAGPANEVWMPGEVPAELWRWQREGSEWRQEREWFGWEERRVPSSWELEGALAGSERSFVAAVQSLLPRGLEMDCEGSLRRAASLGFVTQVAAAQYAMLTAHYGRPPEEISAVRQFADGLGVPLPAAMDELILRINRRAGRG